MACLTKNKATICVVNYKTLDFTRLCLRSIRKFTDYPYEVLVVDNDSNDDSLSYLRSLKWIRLIERPHTPESPRGTFDVSAAFDLGLANCNNEFFVAMHTDTFVLHPHWLSDLISHFKRDGNIACVGSGKIELTPLWLQLLKKYTDVGLWLRAISGTPLQRQQLRYWNRTICCLYRTEVLRKEGLSFLMGNNEGFTTGKKLYHEIVDRRYKTVELPPQVMGKYITHLAHATQVINTQDFKLRAKTCRKFNRFAAKILSLPLVQDIINDDSLDK